MSEYTPLKTDTEHENDETHRKNNEELADCEPSPRKPSNEALVWGLVATTLLVVNVLAWAYGAHRLSAIFHALQDALDTTDTRSLPRPDTRNGLEKLL